MSLNWTKLLVSGRAKDVGMAWNEEELASLSEIAKAKKHPTFAEAAPYVREYGPLTVEEYEKKAAKGLPTRADLEKAAKKKKVNFSKETPDTVLKAHVSKKTKGGAKKKK